MILEGAKLKLEPLKNITYFLDLADRDNKYEYSRNETRDFINKCGCEFWKVYAKGEAIGVVGYFKVNGYYVLEGLKDKDAPAHYRYSMEAARLVMDYVFRFADKIRTCARVNDKAVQILCRKLEFKEYARKDYLILYEKER